MQAHADELIKLTNPEPPEMGGAMPPMEGEIPQEMPPDLMAEDALM
jgi:hypothetical protein